ncbi:MAG: GrpB family protein, partial [Pseudomonadota bacterium]
FAENAPHAARLLRFRDHLRRDADAAAAYAALKQRLAKEHADDRAAYTDAKTQFIQQIEA